jgi:hypothetical protein
MEGVIGKEKTDAAGHLLVQFSGSVAADKRRDSLVI